MHASIIGSVMRASMSQRPDYGRLEYPLKVDVFVPILLQVSNTHHPQSRRIHPRSLRSTDCVRSPHPTPRPEHPSWRIFFTKTTPRPINRFSRIIARSVLAQKAASR